MTEPTLPLISIVIPVFNEEGNAARAYQAVCDVFEQLDRFRFEIIFADNHSTDNTFEVVKGLAEADHRVRAMRFTRNYGFQRSLLTAYRHARGAAAIQLDCDLQDSPTHFVEFLRLWEQGHDVVVGVRRSRKENWALNAGRKLFYRTIARLSDDVIVDGGDFRLVDRRILDELKDIHDAHPYTRGLTSTLAARQIGVPYDRVRREIGQSKFPIHRLVGLALDGIFAQSIVPLRIATYIGLTISLGLLLLSIFYAIARIFGGAEWPNGFASLVILLAASTSMIAVFLGIIGEYVGRIYTQLRWRPTTVIEEIVDNTAREERKSATSTPIDKPNSAHLETEPEADYNQRRKNPKT
jgi:glycosyltransferase involved in cell wall biosynthesis